MGQGGRGVAWARTNARVRLPIIKVCGVLYKGKLPVSLACRDRVYGDTCGTAVFKGYTRL